MKGKKDKFYILNKILHGLKQEPIAWYKKIGSYSVKNGFHRCLFKYTLYIKFSEPRDVLILYLYVDDLIISNNSRIYA